MRLFDWLRTSNLRRISRHRFDIETLERRTLLTVPALSSLPGADHTIHLDFDGQTVTGTSWNSYYNQTTLVAPAYDIDGNSGDFNPTELARIEEAWNRVAEDFRPFNVNVTTVDPGVEDLRNTGGGDTKWGVRVIMTNEANMVTDPNERTGAGGIAYIDSFRWSSDTPVWVYTTGGKSIAEAASHEVGHSLGLSHDGTSSSSYYTGHGSGETGWASIMGVGYYENVTQWDRGEYFGTNNGGSGANYGDGPDDLAIMVGQNGFGYRSDDHGDTNGAASALAISGTVVSDGGVIETTNDVDVLSFTTGAGNVVLNIDPFTPGPNLDVLASLYDSGGNLVATSNPTAALDASFNLTLAAGQYFLHVDGTGVGNPGNNPPTGYSDYASLGAYSISGSMVEATSDPSFSVADVTVNEGDNTVDVTVTLSGTVTSTASVDYATADGTADADDYTGTSGTLTFTDAGSQRVTVSITDDLLVEGLEEFTLNLSNASGAVIGDGTAIVSIVDNDTSIAINDASINEGNTAKGKKNAGDPQLRDMVFTVSLANASTSPISVDYNTVDGSATTEDMDYQSASGTVAFAPGETSKTITVTIVGDNRQEGDETFEVHLSNPSGATIADATAVGTILEDDTKGGKGKGKKGQRGIVADPFWYFEGPDGMDLHDHDHDHDHHHVGHDFDHATEESSNGILTFRVNSPTDNLFQTSVQTIAMALEAESLDVDLSSDAVDADPVSQERPTMDSLVAPGAAFDFQETDDAFSDDLEIVLDALV